MNTTEEKKLLRDIKFVPITIFIVLFMLSTFLMIENYKKLFQTNIQNIQNMCLDAHSKNIKKEVQRVIRMIEHEESQFETNKNIFQTKSQLQQYILKNIESMKYDQSGYIFIIDYEGNFLIHIKQSLIERNQLNLQDNNGFLITKEIITLAKNGGGYLSYIGIDGTHKTQSEKISYVEAFKKWNWIVGYGYHPNDLTEEFEKQKQKFEILNQQSLLWIVIVNIILSLVFVSSLLYFSKKINFKFKKYKKDLKHQYNENCTKDEIIFHQAKMATIGELLNLIAHQWRQPLAQINAITLDTYIEQKQKSLTDEMLNKNIHDIEKITQYLSSTIDDFMVFFAQEKEKHFFSALESVKKCLDILSVSLNNIEITIKCEKDITLFGFSSLYQQVLLTILTNTLDIFEQRNIQNRKIIININTDGINSIVEICDNGLGIIDEYKDKIFDLYFSTKNNKNINGLGLYISKNIIEKNFKGNITAHNHNLGACFTIKTPSITDKV